MYVFSARLLREARLAAGLGQDQVATACGRSWFTVREYERGRTIPPTDVVGRLAAVLGVDPGALFTRAGGDAHAA